MSAAPAVELAGRVVALVLVLQAAACAADAPQGEVLPGHSRPVLEHDWPHPRDLAFDDSGFRPADAAAALVTTPSGVRAFILPDTADPLAEVTAVLPLGRQFEADDEVGAADVVSRVLARLRGRRKCFDSPSTTTAGGSAGADVVSAGAIGAVRCTAQDASNGVQC